HLTRQFLVAVAVICGISVVGFYFFPALRGTPPIEGWTPFGTINIFSRPFRFIETWGVHGFITLGLAVWFWGLRSPVAVLCLLPLSVFLLPPVAMISNHIGYADSHYRIIYLFPSGVALVYFLWILASRYLSHIEPRVGLTLAGVLLIALSLPRDF